MFEELFDKMGEKIDKTMREIGDKVQKTSEEIRQKAEKTREDISDEFLKKMNKFGERISPDNKNLSNFEKVVANIAVGVAHSLEEGYKKVVKSLFLTEKERKTKYGILGKVWSSKYVPKERAGLCLRYALEAEKRLQGDKLKGEILKDIVESLSSSNTEIYSYYVYHHFTGSKRSKNHEEKKKIVREFFMSKEERRFYEGKNGQ